MYFLATFLFIFLLLATNTEINTQINKQLPEDKDADDILSRHPSILCQHTHVTSLDCGSQTKLACNILGSYWGFYEHTGRH